MKDVPEQIIIDGVKYIREPQPEPEYESVKLVYNWDDNIEPVNRRWEELSLGYIEKMRDEVEDKIGIVITNLDMNELYDIFYEAITKEKHP